MSTALRSKTSRRLAAGLALIAVSVASVFAYRGRQSPWIPSAPDFRQQGPSGAKVALVEFSDFQCPSCAFAVGQVRHIQALYGSDVRLVFKYFPWDFHRWAKTAAVAAECAGRQGKFWEMYDALFSKQTEWAEADNGDRLIDSYSKSIPLDRAAYERCLADPSALAAVEADWTEGREHWIHSTPTFFINGLRVVGSNQLRVDGLREIERLTGKKEK